MTKLPKSLKGFSNAFEKANERCYKQISGEGTNFWKFKIVPPEKVKAFTKISIEKCTWTEWNWTYRNAEFNYHVSRKHSLPIECDGIVNLTSRLVGTQVVTLNVRKNRQEVQRTRTVKVHKVTWVSQGKGTNVYHEKGFIAQLGDMYYHGDSFEKVVRGIVKKFHLQGQHEARQREQKRLEAMDKKSFLASIPEKLMLSYNDSIAVGNCAKGTRNFINRHSLDKRKKYPARVIMRLARDTAQEYNVRVMIEYKLAKKKAKENPIVNEPSEPRPLPSFKRGTVWHYLKGWFSRTFLGTGKQVA